MHLLIDIRQSSLSDIPSIHYGIEWARIWKRIHIHDRITFLTNTGNEILGEECISISSGYHLFQKKISNHGYGPDRIISFSSLPPIDTSIPIILHVSDLRKKHYEEGKWGVWVRLTQERSLKKLYSTARHIIVPWKEIGRELEELYTIPESSIVLLPYVMKERESLSTVKKVALTHGISDEYFITEGTPTNEWQPLELIQAYSRYIHEYNWQEELLILWDLGENFDKVVSLIRSLGLLRHIKIIGLLSKEEREELYSNAKGWIFIGYYYSRWASIELAHSYNIPLYLSEIPGLSGYNGTYIHPNHIDQIASILGTSQTKSAVRAKNNNQEIMQVYARIISE